MRTMSKSSLIVIIEPGFSNYKATPSVYLVHLAGEARYIITRSIQALHDEPEADETDPGTVNPERV